MPETKTDEPFSEEWIAQPVGALTEVVIAAMNAHPPTAAAISAAIDEQAPTADA